MKTAASMSWVALLALCPCLGASNAAAQFQTPDTSHLVPINDLGTRQYQGFEGGLYPGGSNRRPEAHERLGMKLASEVQPLDAEGKPGPEGKIVLLGIGFSNTVQAFDGFQKVAKGDDRINPALLLINGAVGGMSAEMVQQDEQGRGAQYWETVDARLKAAGVTRAQVQVVWIKETNPQPNAAASDFPRAIQDLQGQIRKIVGIIHRRFPNVKLAYLSSRTYGGWAKARPNGGAPGNSEPYSYETGFAVKWLVAEQIDGRVDLNADPSRGPVAAPWLSWGPYLWANGQNPRLDGFQFVLDDFRENDRMHESPSGQLKVGKQLVDFFATDPTSRSWFLKRVD